VALDSKEIVKRVRYELNRCVDSQSDRQLKERIADALRCLGERPSSSIQQIS